MFLKGETQLPPAVVELSGAFMDAWEAHVLQDRFATSKTFWSICCAITQKSGSRRLRRGSWQMH